MVNDIKAVYPYAVASTGVIDVNPRVNEINRINIGLASRTRSYPEGYDHTKRFPLTAADILDVDSRNTLLIVGYLNGDEGASTTECIYSMYNLLHGAVLPKPEIVHMLKMIRVSLVCVLNTDRLKEIEDHYKSSANTNQDVLIRIKNTRQTSSCPAESTGVNLKYNFAEGVAPSDPCSPFYPGQANQREPEIYSLQDLLAREPQVQSVVFLHKYSKGNTAGRTKSSKPRALQATPLKATWQSFSRASENWRAAHHCRICTRTHWKSYPPRPPIRF